MNNGIKIREMKISDISTIIRIGNKTKEFEFAPNFEGFWSRKQLNDWIRSRNDVLIVAEENKNLIGFMMFSIHHPTKEAILQNVWVSPKSRGKGVGSILFNEGIDRLKIKKIDYISSLVKGSANLSIKFHKKNEFDKGFEFIWFHKLI